MPSTWHSCMQIKIAYSKTSVYKDGSVNLCTGLIQAYKMIYNVSNYLSSFVHLSITTRWFNHQLVTIWQVSYGSASGGDDSLPDTRYRWWLLHIARSHSRTIRGFRTYWICWRTTVRCRAWWVATAMKLSKGSMLLLASHQDYTPSTGLGKKRLF